MKILFFIDNLGSGGAQRQITSIAVSLKKVGVRVSVLVYGRADFFVDKLNNENIDIHYLNAKNYVDRIFKVRRYIRSGGFDAVISFLYIPNFLNCISAIGGKDWKVITSERSAKEELFYSIRGRLLGRFQYFSDALVCNSYNAMNLWKKHYPKYEKKLSVIYNQVSLPDVKVKYIPRKEGKTNILVAASYQYIKNPIAVIMALLLLSEEEREKINILWYGQKKVSHGNSRAYDEALYLIQKNYLEGVIQLMGPTKNIIDKMYQADFVGLFSSVEGLPNAVCEGLTLGKPIIMSKVSDYSVLVDESNGFLCDWDNPETIKSTFVNAINLTNEKLISMGKKSGEKSLQLFSQEIIVNQWLNIVNEDEKN